MSKKSLHGFWKNIKMFYETCIWSLTRKGKKEWGRKNIPKASVPNSPNLVRYINPRSKTEKRIYNTAS